ncbi:MAG: hypothetical protein ACD_79C00141G0001, partial [uncultured bacterium]
DNKNPVYIKELIQRLEEQAKTEPQGMEGILQAMMQGKVDMSKGQEMMKNNAEEQKKKVEEINNKLMILYKVTKDLSTKEDGFKFEVSEKLIKLKNTSDAVEILKTIKSEKYLNQAYMLRIKLGFEGETILKDLSSKINYETLDESDAKLIFDSLINDKNYASLETICNGLKNEANQMILVDALVNNLINMLQQYKPSENQILENNINKVIEILGNQSTNNEMRQKMKNELFNKIILSKQKLMTAKFSKLKRIIFGEGLESTKNQKVDLKREYQIELYKSISLKEDDIKNLMWFTVIVGQIKKAINKGNIEEIQEAWSKQSNVITNHVTVISKVEKLLKIKDVKVMELVSKISEGDIESFDKLLLLQNSAFSLISGNSTHIKEKNYKDATIDNFVVLDIRNKDVFKLQNAKEVLSYYQYSISKGLEFKIAVNKNSAAWNQLISAGFEEYLIGVAEYKPISKELKRREKEELLFAA